MPEVQENYFGQGEYHRAGSDSASHSSRFSGGSSGAERPKSGIKVGALLMGIVGLLAVSAVVAAVIASAGRAAPGEGPLAPNRSSSGPTEVGQTHSGPAGFRHHGAFSHINPHKGGGKEELMPDGGLAYVDQDISHLRNEEHEHHREMQELLGHLDHIPMTRSASGTIIPDLSNKDAVLALAYMTSDAYEDPSKNSTRWIDAQGYKWESSFGWEDKRFGGFRGHIFMGKGKDASGEEAPVAVMSIRGTAVEPAGLKFSERDRIMDNKMFGCCCGEDVRNGGRKACDCKGTAESWSWWPHWHLFGDSSKICRKECKLAHTRDDPCTGYGEPEHECLTPPYIKTAEETLDRLVKDHPDAAIWVIGHSLGGAMAAMLTAKKGGSIPAVAFEAPGEMWYSSWIGVDVEREYEHIYHITNDGDPIPVGKCSGAWSHCSMAGYALESKCHFGWSVLYKGARFGRNVELYHSIDMAIDKFLKLQDPPTPVKFDTMCRDCEDWQYV